MGVAMKKVALILLIVMLGWYGNQKFRRHRLPSMADASEAPAHHQPHVSAPVPESGSFKCDGRTYCSQMTSCAEATFFIQNCSDTKMDGNRDGVPCEKQWCR
jgi:hypothetical protein